jgi:hypothetical protein
MRAHRRLRTALGQLLLEDFQADSIARRQGQSLDGRELRLSRLSCWQLFVRQEPPHRFADRLPKPNLKLLVCRHPWLPP